MYGRCSDTRETEFVSASGLFMTNSTAFQYDEMVSACGIDFAALCNSSTFEQAA
jgi:hypothetical protein